jgi:tetrahydromethanopterin S-methyltransferase subunit G
LETSGNLVQSIADTRRRLADTAVQVDAPLEYADRFAALVRRQQDIEDELDFTKGQASSRLGAARADDPSNLEGEDEEPPGSS